MIKRTTNEEVVSGLHSECFISENNEELSTKFTLVKFSGGSYFVSYRSNKMYICIHIVMPSLLQEKFKLNSAEFLTDELLQESDT
jgi:hypothetical protein